MNSVPPVQLLHELKINSVATEGAQTLLKVVKNPVTDHLPTGCRKVGTFQFAFIYSRHWTECHSFTAFDPQVY